MQNFLSLHKLLKKIMKALEFNSYITQNTIKLPPEYKKYNNRNVKIIVLLQETRNYDKQELLTVFENAQELKIFQEIKNPVEWQKQIRDEWE